MATRWPFVGCLAFCTPNHLIQLGGTVATTI
jgi:hypothetical protein